MMRILAAVVLASACSSGGDRPGSGDAALDDGGPATPVRTALVQQATLLVVVDAPGHTASIEQQQVRAPFAGKLLTFDAADGNVVGKDQPLGTLVSENSLAALEGARVMKMQARTPRQRANAARAMQLAERGLVKYTLRAPEAGVVVSHNADEGAIVAANEVITTIAALDSIVFIADVVQNDLPRIHPGESARINLAAETGWHGAVVHSVLPAASANTLTAPVRLDFAPRTNIPTAMGLFGTAHIVVGERRNVLAVPAAAVLRDDITGVTRIAVITWESRLRWIRVTTGISENGLVEITSPSLPVGEPVIVSGQVGLSDGAKVQPES